MQLSEQVHAESGERGGRARPGGGGRAAAAAAAERSLAMPLIFLLSSVSVGESSAPRDSPAAPHGLLTDEAAGRVRECVRKLCAAEQVDTPRDIARPQHLQRDKDYGVRTGAARRRARAAAGGPGPAALLHAAHAGHHRRQTHRQGELFAFFLINRRDIK